MRRGADRRGSNRSNPSMAVLAWRHSSTACPAQSKGIIVHSPPLSLSPSAFIGASSFSFTFALLANRFLTSDSNIGHLHCSCFTVDPQPSFFWASLADDPLQREFPASTFPHVSCWRWRSLSTIFIQYKRHKPLCKDIARIVS